MPRWPFMLISSPSGPCTMLTPGVSVSRSSNLRPSTGVVSMVLSSRVAVEESVTMSTAGGGGDDDRLGGAGHLQRELKGCGKTDGQSEVLLDGARKNVV